MHRCVCNEADLHPQVNQIPFVPEYQFAASFNKVDDGVSIFIKGAPEKVLAMCTESSDSGEGGDQREFNPAHFEQTATGMAAQGYRVLALADAKISQPVSPNDVPPAPSNLRFLGFVGMIDPLRPGVKDAPALSAEELNCIDAYWRATDYLSVGQMYLFDRWLGDHVVTQPVPIECARRS